jgi:Zn-dependent protease with chaperone function
MRRSILAAIALGLAAWGIAPVRAARAAEIPANGGAISSEPFDATVTVPEPTPKAVHLHRTGLVIWASRQVWALLVPATWIASGAAVALSRGTRRRSFLAHVAAFAASYYLIMLVVNLPWSVYLGFIRPHDYGLSTQTLADYVADDLKATALSLAMFVAMVTGLYAFIRHRPRTWWIWSGLAVVPLSMVLAYVLPIWVDPLFHEYGPMRDQALEARILALADRAGIEGSRVYEVDMSRETVAVNAYVTGLLGTKRVVLWDTLLAKLKPDEVLAVVAHEVGHYVLNHVLQGLVVGGGLVFVGLGLVAAAVRRIVPAWTARFGIRRLDDPASLPVLLLLAQLLNFALTPVGYAVSRHVEHEADRFALELTRDNQAAARAFVAIQGSNLGYPRPGLVHTIFRSTHPSLGERIDFCNRYRPWRDGTPLRYASLFRDPPDADAQPPATGAPLVAPR